MSRCGSVIRRQKQRASDACKLSYFIGRVLRLESKGKIMSVDKAKDTSPKKPITENKIVEAKPESSTEIKNKPDATPKKQGMGEGQKPVSKAYKDNWNDIFGKKKKR
jgi:hypothetical protein